MFFYVLKRLGMGVLTIWFIATATFFAMHLVPGDPLSGEKAASPIIRANMMKQYGLDMNSMLHGDFGISFSEENRFVNDIIREHFPVSATLGVLALLFATLGGILCGRGAPLGEIVLRLADP